jgi:ubiquinol-cytochrome c reductase cytochrome c1 subunit
MVAKLATKLLLGLGLLAGAAGPGAPALAAEGSGGAELGAHAEDGGHRLKDVAWPHDGMFGTFDRAGLQRGFQVYQNVCQSCHGMKYLAFRNLEALGYGEEEIKAIAAQYTVVDGPNDQGEMFERPGRPSDRKPGPYKNEAEARAAQGGALPPDLSLLVKAREGHEDYVYSVLTGYQEPPPDVEPREGMYYNPYYPGQWIAMPPPLAPDAVTYEDGTPATPEQMAHDVTQFLALVAEPTLEVRKQTGLKVVLFLIVVTGLFLAYKRRIWADVH